MAPKLTPVATPRSSTRTKTPVVVAAASSSTSKDSKGKKRVRVVEPEDEAAPAPVAAKGKKAAAAPVLVEEKKDLKEKALDEIKSIVSAEAPAPGKPSLKKATAAGGKKAKAAAVVEEAVVDEIEKEEEEEEEEIDFLQGFESEEGGEDSSDEEMEGQGEEDAPFKVESLPIVEKDEAGVQKKLEEKAERKRNAKTGTIYLGRIPHGFHEAEMKSYFSQFGEITRLRLSRNKNSGASKHYAFIEFAYASVAQIVQETMDNYLLSGHILVCKIVPDNEIHPKLWIGANRTFRPVPKGRRDKVKRAAPKTDSQKESLTKRLLKREEAKRTKLAALGIDYDFSGYAGKAVQAPPAVAPAADEKVKAVKGKAAKKEKVVKEKKAKAVEGPPKKKARKST